jgi:hypothetical protein
LECGREAAAFNKPNKEGGSFAAALQGALRAHRITSSSLTVGNSAGGLDAEKAASSRRTPRASPLINKHVALIEFPGDPQYIDSHFRNSKMIAATLPFLKASVNSVFKEGAQYD